MNSFVLGVAIFLVASRAVDSSKQAGTQGPIKAELVHGSRLPLHTQGRYIVDNSGRRVKWACVAWYGSESGTYVSHGLEVRPMKELVHRIRDLGFNCVRLPYSIQGQVENPVVKSEFLTGNPQLYGKRWHELFDDVVAALTGAGLMVIIDQHVSKAGWCCFASQPEGLWYQPGYPEKLWAQSLVNITARYRNNPLVVAVELRNEVHDYGSVSVTWGSGDRQANWFRAASEAAAKVQRANSNILIVVEALCFGMELRGLRNGVVQPPIPNHVVYAVHSYLEFLPWANFDAHFVPWHLVSLICFVVALFILAKIVRLLLHGREVRQACPKRKVVAKLLALWTSLTLVICTSICFVVWRLSCFFCSFWSRHYISPIFKCLLVALLLSIIASVVLTWVAKIPDQQADTDDYKPLEEQEQHNPQDAKETLPLNRIVGLGVALIFTLVLLVLGIVFPSYEFQKFWYDDTFGFVFNEDYAFTAPVWMGEFAVTVNGGWWANIIRYLYENDLDYGYWAINGRKWSPGNINLITGSFDFYPEPRWDDEPYGLLDHDYQTIRSMWRYTPLQRLMPARAQ